MINMGKIKEVKREMRFVKQMHTHELVQATRAARALYNVGWRIRDIAEALYIFEDDIKALTKIRIV